MRQRLSDICSCLAAVAVAAIALILCLQAVDICRTGLSAANRDAAGVLLNPVFSRQIVADRLHAMRWPLLLSLSVLVLSSAVCLLCGGPARRKRSGRVHVDREKPLPRLPLVRGVLYAAAAALLLWGILNSGLRDVLVKAINICTECIGLG